MLLEEWADGIENIVDTGIGMEGQLRLIESCNRAISTAAAVDKIN